jgi:hypothetical protein
VFDEWLGIEYIGKPIPNMVDKVMALHDSGITIKIFTARAADPKSIPIVKKWLKDNGLPDWEITNAKNWGMVEMWDDRCKQVKPNTREFA